MILFCVYIPKEERVSQFQTKEQPTDVVFTLASGREHAKRNAQPLLFGNPDKYIVNPLTREGDRLTFALAGGWVQT